MSEAIVYCDQCGRMIPHSEVMGGEALVSSDAFALCATCAASLTQEQRAAIIMRKSSAAIAAVKKRPRAPAAAAGAAGGPPPRRHARPPGQATASRRKSRASDRIPGQGRPAKPRSVAGFVILGGGMLVGVAIAVFALGRRPERPGKGSRKPPSARRRVAVPADQTPAPDAGGAQPQDTVSQPLVSDAAAGRLDKIRGMIEPTLGSYAEIVSGLEAFPDEFPGTTEAAKAKELLAKVKSDFSALAEGEFRAARELAAEGKHVQATSLLGSIQGRFSDSEWYRTRGKGEVEAALRDAKDAPAGGGQADRKDWPGARV